MTNTLKQYLPASMFQAVDLLPKNGQPVVLLTRHSIRELADNQGFATYQLPLTDVGRHLAFEWGHWLSQNTDLQIATCLSSPIPRCVDTAIEMLKGADLDGTMAAIHADKSNTQARLLSGDMPANQSTLSNNQRSIIHTPLSLAIDQHGLLVEPGSFVLDIAQAGPHFMKKGALTFINQFLNHQLPGMKMPIEGAQDILRLLFNHLPQQSNQLLLAVSHDTILAALFSVMAGQSRIERKDWPDMMEGAFLWFDGEQFEHSVVNWIWRGQYYRFKPQLSQPTV